MSSGRRDDFPDPPPGGPPEPGNDEGLLTSEDLFGDLVDAVPEPEPPRPAVARSAPVRVRVSEPSVPRRPERAPMPKEVGPEDMAALLDAFGGLDGGVAELPPAAPVSALGSTSVSDPDPAFDPHADGLPGISEADGLPGVSEADGEVADLLDGLSPATFSLEEPGPQATHTLSGVASPWDEPATRAPEPAEDFEAPDEVADLLLGGFDLSAPADAVMPSPEGAETPEEPAWVEEPTATMDLESFAVEDTLDPETFALEDEGVPEAPPVARNVEPELLDPERFLLEPEEASPRSFSPDADLADELPMLDVPVAAAVSTRLDAEPEVDLDLALGLEDAEPEDASQDDLLLGMLEPEPGEGRASPTQPAMNIPGLRELLAAAEPVRPASRIATKFQAAPPQKAAVEASLDLAGLAEDAFSEGSRASDTPARNASGVPKEDTYGPYKLLERVAVGGMAEVFRAKRSGVEGFEKIVAVKRILPHLSDNKEFVDMFVDEAKLVAGLTHPNIVQIFDLGKIDKTYYIAMEYVPGKDLRTILRCARERGLRLPLDLSVLVVSRVCAALEYAHRARDDQGRAMRIVHRDISPQNILISFEGDVKLTDFGIAKAATKATSTDSGALRGKLLYMSPEQAWGKPMDRRSDVFSLGIVFYEMVTDQKPFLGTSEMSILETVRECRISPPTSFNARLPEKIEKVILKALERDPDDRYQDAAEMARDLERVLRERQAPTPVELARYMEILFDESGRVGNRPDESQRPETNERGLEIELDNAPEVPATEKTAPGATGTDPTSIQKLLKRFGIK
jgi:serine/threonine protein kinase